MAKAEDAEKESPRGKRRLMVFISLSLIAAAVILFYTLQGQEDRAVEAMTVQTSEVFVSSEESTGRKLLPVETILQKPELPNGCEVTSLSMLLGFWGFEANKCELFRDYLPTQKFMYSGGNRHGGDPEQVYIGDPSKEKGGFYCFAPPLVKAGNDFLAQQTDEIRLEDSTGFTEEELIAQLDAGSPVIVWCTVGLETARTNPDRAWLINGTGVRYTPYRNLHCMLLIGYNETKFYFADPLGTDTIHPRESFMHSYEEIGSRAVTVKADGSSSLETKKGMDDKNG